ncbi:hypothetical protein ACDX78_13590 [Virgibacillus oceani]
MSKEINTYPEMNETIKDILRLSDEQHDQYILKRIIELEEENERYKQALEYYADRTTYEPLRQGRLTMIYSPIELDLGDRARKDLKGESQ